jgi:hypothetical protein
MPTGRAVMKGAKLPQDKLFAQPDSETQGDLRSKVEHSSRQVKLVILDHIYTIANMCLICKLVITFTDVFPIAAVLLAVRVQVGWVDQMLDAVAMLLPQVSCQAYRVAADAVAGEIFVHAN